MAIDKTPYAEAFDEVAELQAQEKKRILADSAQPDPADYPASKMVIFRWFDRTRFDGIRYGLSSNANDIESVYTKSRGEGFGKEVRRRIILGTYILSHGYYDAYYRKAVDVSCAIRDELNKALEKSVHGVDAIFTPTSPFAPFAIGERVDDPLAMKMSDLFTVPANIAGLPAISVPFGKDKKGMPVGMQFMGPQLEDDMLFSIAKILEEENKV